MSCPSHWLWATGTLIVCKYSLMGLRIQDCTEAHGSHFLRLPLTVPLPFLIWLLSPAPTANHAVKGHLLMDKSYLFPCQSSSSSNSQGKSTLLTGGLLLILSSSWATKWTQTLSPIAVGRWAGSRQNWLLSSFGTFKQLFHHYVPQSPHL